MPFLLLLSLVFYAAAAGRAEITVLAAASLTDALAEIGERFESKTGIRVHFSFAGSSTLARQVEEGVPADLFFSADEQKMDVLQKRNLIAPSSRRSFLSNSLAVIARRESKVDLESASTIALAEPNSVPAGIYARAYLQQIGLWERVAPRIIPTENVRAALAAVEAGNADLAIVYSTDARTSSEVRTLQEVPWPSISYPVALLAGSNSAGAAARFLEYLQSPEARAIFAKHGFIVR